MSFIEQHKDYLTYKSEDYYVNDYPDRFDEKISGFLFALSNNCNLRLIVDSVAQILFEQPTQNWGFDYLKNDLIDYSYKLYKSDFYNLFNLFEQLLEKDVTTTDEINRFLSKNEIGYTCEFGSMAIDWILASDNIISKAEKLNDAIIKTKDICEQTTEHLKQAKENLNANLNDRDRKDAIRDCLSALEAFLKKITGTNDIKDAIKQLRANKKYGNDFIVKDGLSIWDLMHKIYPDIRHGNPNSSDLSEDECLYWIDRINTYVIYMCNTHKSLNKF